MVNSEQFEQIDESGLQERFVNLMEIHLFVEGVTMTFVCMKQSAKT